MAPDFRQYVRNNVRALGLSGEKEAEVVDELAIEFQENYERAIRNGLTPDDAWRDVMRRARPWAELGGELQSELREREAFEVASRGSVTRRLADETLRDVTAITTANVISTYALYGRDTLEVGKGRISHDP